VASLPGPAVLSTPQNSFRARLGHSAVPYLNWPSSWQAQPAKGSKALPNLYIRTYKVILCTEKILVKPSPLTGSIQRQSIEVNLMANLRELLAYNMKTQRAVLGISQSKLADRVNTATGYIAMIELGKKFPSPEMIERIAAALEMEGADLFTKSFPPESIKNLRETILTDIEIVVDRVLTDAMKELERNLKGKGKE
jgi:transcriptional regulator with XRE-family HTH domain